MFYKLAYPSFCKKLKKIKIVLNKRDGDCHLKLVIHTYLNTWFKSEIQILKMSVSLVVIHTPRFIKTGVNCLLLASVSGSYSHLFQNGFNSIQLVFFTKEYDFYFFYSYPIFLPPVFVTQEIKRFFFDPLTQFFNL